MWVGCGTLVLQVVLLPYVKWLYWEVGQWADDTDHVVADHSWLVLEAMPKTANSKPKTPNPKTSNPKR